MMLKNGLIQVIMIKIDKRPLPIGENKKVLAMFKDELGGKIMDKICRPRPQKYAYILDDNSECKKAKGTKKCAIKLTLKLEDYYNSIFKNKNILRSQLTFKSNCQIISTINVNKIAISSNDDKRIQTFDKIITYPYGTSVFKICESEMLLFKK